MPLGEEFLACGAGQAFCVGTYATKGAGLGRRGLADGFGQVGDVVFNFLEGCDWGRGRTKDLVLSEGRGQARQGLNRGLRLRCSVFGWRIAVIVDTVA